MAYDDTNEDYSIPEKEKYIFICCGAKQTTTDPRMLCLKCKKSQDPSMRLMREIFPHAMKGK